MHATFLYPNSRFKRDVTRRILKEIGYRPSNVSERGRLLAEIAGRTLFGDETHVVRGLPQGSLGDGTVSTVRLSQARDDIRAMPNVEMVCEPGYREIRDVQYEAGVASNGRLDRGFFRVDEAGEVTRVSRNTVIAAMQALEAVAA